MAKIGAELALRSNMAGMVESMTRANNALLMSFQRIRQTSITINVTNLHTARNEITNIVGGMREAEEAIQKSDKVQKDLNKDLKIGGVMGGSLTKHLTEMAAKLSSLKNFQNVTEISDSLARTKSKLNAVNDGNQSTDALNKQIYESAQGSHTPYFETANAAAGMITDSGKAFQSNEEAIAFTELMNKQMAIDGVALDDQAGVMSLMTQAMAAGILQGEALNSVLSTSPGIAANIEESMGWAAGSLQDYADKGLVTSDVVRNSMYTMAGGINETFGGMNQTFEQLWTGIKDQALWAFKPIMESFNELANGDEFQVMISEIINALSILGGLAFNVFEFLAGVAGMIAENWSIIQPIIGGVVAGMLLYLGILTALNTAEAISTGIKQVAALHETILAAAKEMNAGATFAETRAQYGLNVALLACPITWIILAIIAVVAIIYAVIAAINKLTGQSISATGFICGCINVIIQFFLNLFKIVGKVFSGILLAGMGAITNLSTAFYNGICNIQGFFYNMVATVLGGIEKIAEGLNNLPFIEFEYKNLSDTAENYKQKAQEAYEKKEEYVDIGELFNEGMNTFSAFEDGWKDNAYNTGYNFGSNLFKKEETGNEFDYDKFLRDPEAVGTNLNQISDNTYRTADNTTQSNEDLKYLRDIAERESINRFTTAQLSVTMDTTASINKDMDIDGVIAQLEEKTFQTLLAVAEGV